MNILGLAGVFSVPEARGKGLGRTVVRAAFELVDRGDFPYCLFQTSKAVRGFYESLGACAVSNRITNGLTEQPDVCPFWDDVIMRYPSQGDWPEGTIDLCGPGY
jgi:GNAT superfamily N-acetyltransferase